MFRRCGARADPGVSPSPPPVRRPLRRVLSSALLLGLAGLVVAGSLVVLRREPGRPPGPGAASRATAEVQRRNLSSGQSLTGEVGFGAASQLTGRASGTVTWLPRSGRTIRLGRPLYRADDQPVALFYGTLPMYRPIATKNLVGRDVRVVADNLAALGYDIGPQPSTGEQISRRTAPGVNGTVVVRSGESVLTADLKDAIRHWQEDSRRTVTGRIDIGDVEIRPGPVRVEGLLAQTGSPADQPLMTLTATRKVVTVPATMSEAGGIRTGEKVGITLPDGTRVPGHVVGKGRRLNDSDSAGGPQKLDVTVAVDAAKELKKIDAADVQVTFVAQTVKDVLVVPVEALVSLQEGGYAVEPADDSGLVAVRTGLFADGMVQIQGQGLKAGLSVVVAS